MDYNILSFEMPEFRDIHVQYEDTGSPKLAYDGESNIFFRFLEIEEIRPEDFEISENCDGL